MNQLAKACPKSVLKIRYRDNNGHNFSIRKQMLDKRDLNLDAVFVAVSAGVGDSANGNNLTGQFKDFFRRLSGKGFLCHD